MNVLQKKYLLILIALSGCTTSLRFTSDFDKRIDFTKFRTYSFYEEGIKKLNLNSLDRERVVTAVENEMESKGFKIARSTDILVNIIAIAKDQTKSDWGYSGGGYVYDYTESAYRWTDSQWGPNADISHFTAATLIIDFLDPVTKNLLWRGQVSGFNMDDFNRRDERIISAVEKVLRQYPPVSSTNRYLR